MPHIHADRQGILRARARILRRWRDWFEGQGFLEVDTAALQISPGNEAHIGAFATKFEAGGQDLPLYLHSSPEFACKKLLAAGESQIFSLGHVFRNGERGPLHHPEFTMLEWYRAGADYECLITDCRALLVAAAEGAGVAVLRWKGRECDPFAPPERLSVAQAFADHAGVELLATLSSEGEPDRAALVRQAEGKVRIVADDSWSDIFSKLLSEYVEPQLGLERPCVLIDYPACEAALARPCAHDKRVAERFELYACGVELANAFGELTDPVEQRRRFEAEMEERARLYGERFPIDEDFLDALALMPQACGIALGVDRLIMLATGAQRIEQVIWTPVAEGTK